MQKKLLAVFAHPDDEAFGPAGTLAKYAAEGVEVHLLCATKGEAGQNNIQGENKAPKIEDIREKELLRSAEVLGVKKVEFLGFIDGELRNNIYHAVADKVMDKIKSFKPQVIITSENRGVSGHLDHIAISMITTYTFLHTDIPQKLYYSCIPKELRDKMKDDYFVYFPPGYEREEITTRIDYTKFWQKKIDSMKAHQSQITDVESLLKRFGTQPKIDHFILQFYRNVKVSLPETDLFSGIK